MIKVFTIEFEKISVTLNPSLTSYNPELILHNQPRKL